MVDAVWCGVDEMIFAFNLEGEVLFVVCAPIAPLSRKVGKVPPHASSSLP